MAECGTSACAGGAELRVRERSAGKSVHWAGLSRCGSIWACPACHRRAATQRAKCVEAVLEKHRAEHGRESALMLSCTVSHGNGDELRELRRGVSRAWRRVQGHRRYREFVAERSLAGFIRALETTHGWEHGWHPHLHQVLLFDAALDDETLEGLETLVFELWSDAVARELGEQCRPDREHGVRATHVHQGGYLAKLGLELSEPGAKGARHGNRTPWEIARDLVEDGDERDAELWREYCDGMKGARQLTWSRGLRERYGVREEADEAVSWTLARFSGWQFGQIRDQRLEAQLLNAAEDLLVGERRHWAVLMKRLKMNPKVRLTPPEPSVVDGVFELSYGRKAA